MKPPQQCRAGCHLDSAVQAEAHQVKPIQRPPRRRNFTASGVAAHDPQAHAPVVGYRGTITRRYSTPSSSMDPATACRGCVRFPQSVGASTRSPASRPATERKRPITTMLNVPALPVLDDPVRRSVGDAHFLRNCTHGQPGSVHVNDFTPVHYQPFASKVILAALQNQLLVTGRCSFATSDGFLLGDCRQKRTYNVREHPGRVDVRLRVRCPTRW